MGILLTFERSKALAGAGRGAQGAAELYQIVRKAKAVPEAEKIPALGMSKIGAGACRALSELSDQTGGEIYAPEIQYHVGIGYFLRTRPELAVSAFKGVLTAARTQKEREEWVPQAVRQIGNMLFQQERYLELRHTEQKRRRKQVAFVRRILFAMTALFIQVLCSVESIGLSKRHPPC